MLFRNVLQLDIKKTRITFIIQILLEQTCELEILLLESYFSF